MTALARYNGTPHCGACHKPFDTSEAILEHLDTCPAAAALKYPVLMTNMGADRKHLVGHVMWALTKYHHLIPQYAAIIAEDVSSMERGRMHSQLCEKLGLDYASFRPFESEGITTIPTQEEAEKIIWVALGEYLREYIKKELLSMHKKPKP